MITDNREHEGNKNSNDVVQRGSQPSVPARNVPKPGHEGGKDSSE